MKSSIIFKIILIATVLQLSSCVKEKAKITKEEKLISEVTSDTIFDAKNIYYSFIKNNYPKSLDDNELINFKIDDIDLDGNKEAIIALGTKDDEITINTIFLLRNENGVVKKIEHDFESFYSYEVKFAALQDKKQKFIHLNIIKRGSSYGFSLVELKGSKVSEFFLATPFGEGSCYLIDKNKDGKYDGYIKSYEFSDAVNYEVEEYYDFKNNTFEQSATHVKMDDYPESIKDLLLQYISLRSLFLKDSPEINKRLKQICVDQNASAIKWNKDVWSEACSNSNDDSDKSIEVNIQEDNKTAVVSYTDEEQKQYGCEFEFEKSGSKWRITKVNVIKDGEK